jgi:feruloyl esterase
VATLLCASVDSAACLTAPQLESVRSVYAPRRTKAGITVFPGKELGSEAAWTLILRGTPPLDRDIGAFQVAYDDARWNWEAFDLDRDLKVVDDHVGPIVNAINPDLSAFKAHGGKLLLFHGWNDTAISPGNTIDYYSAVLSTMGPKQDGWIRLFMAPGMQHCGLQIGPAVNGPGPNQVTYIRAIERWRESDIAPDRLVASHHTANEVDMTRPLCPYPEVAQFQGTGSTNDAANFACRLP